MKQNFIEYFKSLPSYLMYTNNSEYRNILRVIFQMDTSKLCAYAELDTSDIIQEDLDEESRDEMQFDMEKVNSNLNALYECTKQEYVFEELYKNAAGKMFSTDPLIGQAVLCSYDYFMLYHSCLWFFFHAGPTGILESAEYKQLIQKLDN